MISYDEAMNRALSYHGHICSGQVLGVRMVRHGLRLLHLENDDLRDIMIFVESDRCVLDAVYAAAGMTMGRRRVKLKSHGKTAMSIVKMDTGLGLRLWVKTPDFPPEDADCRAWWDERADEDIFGVQAVRINIPPEEMPGRPKRIETCASCGLTVLDNHHVERDGKTLCRDCAEGPYWEAVEEAGS